MKSIVFSLFLQLIVLNVSDTIAECTGKDRSYNCNGGKISDLDKISSDAAIIRIEDMRVGKLSSNIFNRFGNLQVFQCSNCGLTEIDHAPFKALPNLEQLVLKNNELTKIRGDWFFGPNYLSVLDLSWNKIKNIESGDFGNVTSLTDLLLSGNPLDCVDPKALDNMKELVSLGLADTPNFRCPKAILSFAKSRKIDLKQDERWDLNQKEKFEVTDAPKPAPTKPSNIETLAPDMVSEDVDIPTLTTLAIQIPPAVIVETTTEMNVEKTVIVPIENEMKPTEQNNVDSLPVTQGPILVTASKLPEVYVPPETTKPPIIALPVKPTSGEESIAPPVIGISTSDNDTEISSAQSGSTESLHDDGKNGGSRPEYFLTMFVVTFYCSLL